MLPDNILILSLTAGFDYIAVNQLLTFPDGAAVGNSLGRQCFFVQTTEDFTPEPNESLQLTLTSGSPSFLAVQTGHVTATVIIQDDDGMLIPDAAAKVVCIHALQCTYTSFCI